MLKALTILSVGGALIMSAPAFAQSYYDQGTGTGHREAVIRDRIADGLDRGDLSYDQAQRLRTELNQIVNLDARYTDEGRADWQVRDINSRLSLLRSRLDYDLGADAGY
ncbi:MAG TPA: hypothetical protein VME40_00995 [Caulobacteraceae bacterium]|nr:hypothetical protein [Caulobacteraceae bacterium]